jgi:hypothetical protein
MKQANLTFKKVLQSLVDKQDKGIAARISSNEVIMKEYRDSPYPSFPLEFEGLVSEYELDGMIEVKRFKNSAGIQSLSLKDYDAITSLLGHTPLSSKIEVATRSFKTSITQNTITEKVLELAKIKWENNAGFLGCRVEEFEKLIEITGAGLAVMAVKDSAKTIDYRHFSATHLCHSKRLNDIKGKVADLIKLFDEEVQDLNSEELLTSYGVVKLNHPVQVSGGIHVVSGEIQLDARFEGGIGFKATYVELIEPLVAIKTVSTIENKATFDKYIENRSQDEVVLFTSGIPSPEFKQVYKMIIDGCKPTEIKHWGDIDLGGFTILRMLESSINQPIQAFNMHPEQYSQEYDKFSVREKKLLSTMNVSKSNKPLLDFVISNGSKYEQESFDWNGI